MKFASIDIGTNTLRLLIAEVSPQGAFRPLIYKRTITRLGGGYTSEAGIDRDAAERSVRALEVFSGEISASGVEDVGAAATSVVRRARNRDWFLKEVEKRTGIKARVITGDEEARLSLLGVLSVISGAPERRLVIDIGGGSTEFIVADKSAMKGAWSMEMGVVHLTEAHLKGDPPGKTEISAMEAEIRGVIDGLKGRILGDGINPADYSSAEGAVFVGTAGTITTLAALDQRLEAYDRNRINNYVLGRDRARGLYDYLLSLTLGERSEVLSLEKGREDLIIPGAAIALISMESFGFDGVLVSDAGLLEGIIIDAVSAPKAPGAKARRG